MTKLSKLFIPKGWSWDHTGANFLEEEDQRFSETCWFSSCKFLYSENPAYVFKKYERLKKKLSIKFPRNNFYSTQTTLVLQPT